MKQVEVPQRFAAHGGEDNPRLGRSSDSRSRAIRPSKLEARLRTTPVQRSDSGRPISREGLPVSFALSKRSCPLVSVNRNAAAVKCSFRLGDSVNEASDWRSAQFGGNEQDLRVAALRVGDEHGGDAHTFHGLGQQQVAVGEVEAQIFAYEGQVADAKAGARVAQLDRVDLPGCVRRGGRGKGRRSEQDGEQDGIAYFLMVTLSRPVDAGRAFGSDGAGHREWWRVSATPRMTLVNVSH